MAHSCKAATLQELMYTPEGDNTIGVHWLPLSSSLPTRSAQLHFYSTFLEKVAYLCNSNSLIPTLNSLQWDFKLQYFTETFY